MNREFHIEEIGNGYIVRYQKKSGDTVVHVYEFNNEVKVDIAKKQTMCRMMNDIATYFSVNGATDDITVVAQLEGERPHKGKVEPKLVDKL